MRWCTNHTKPLSIRQPLQPRSWEGSVRHVLQSVLGFQRGRMPNKDGIDFIKGNRRLERDVADIHKTLNSDKEHMEKSDQIINSSHEQEIGQLQIWSVWASDFGE